MEFALGLVVGCVIAGPVLYFLGLRHRAPADESKGDTMRIMLSGPTTRPPAR